MHPFMLELRNRHGSGGNEVVGMYYVVDTRHVELVLQSTFLIEEKVSSM